GDHVDHLTRYEMLLPAPDLKQELYAAAPQPPDAHQHAQHVVISCGGVVLDGRFHHESIAAGRDQRIGIRIADSTPLLRDPDIEVGEVVSIEHDALSVHFGPAHAQLMAKLECAARHVRPR